MSNYLVFSKKSHPQAWIGALAAKLLPLIHDVPPIDAHAEALHRLVSGSEYGRPSLEHVSKAIDFLREEGLVRRMDPPSGARNNNVAYWRVSTRGALQLALGQQTRAQLCLTE